MADFKIQQKMTANVNKEETAKAQEQARALKKELIKQKINAALQQGLSKPARKESEMLDTVVPDKNEKVLHGEDVNLLPKFDIKY